MSAPYSNQWVLGRSRWRRRRGAAASGALGPPSQPPGEGRPERREHRDRQGSHETGASRENRDGGRPAPGFDPAFTGGGTRKPPRWIDRDT
jgi:hypothetical protein